ncbi:Alkaline phosphatase synthesis transcriptional regulatory protein SphR [Thalassoglobus neptunius]|uniref:Alkaline phosphatase synthesis transcriptional regulatory protein SphR n=2 Tax=Thalassoglobus neptunius TaxID=1938619 RepID=A0A5C5X108_9PLAN|nr:Alkaline phosphatase synthesis transcriptional regulatory protein SphR [Thalassoglobus neptunius]
MSRGMTPAEVIVNRILVVEDDRDEADFLKTLLKQHKYTVEIAKDAGQAHAAFSMHIPDLVITDAILPNDVSGFEVCERLRQQNPHIPLIMLTAIDMDDARSLASRIGVDAYITKPFEPEELIQNIAAAAEEHWRKRHFGTANSESDKVRFECSECGKHLKVKTAHRGRTLNCPRCGQPVVVPLHD